MPATEGKPDTLKLATDLTVAWLSNPNTRAGADDVPAFLCSVHARVGDLGERTTDDAPAPERKVRPAISARKSLASPEHIISMLDGKPYKTLRRHLARHGLTPEQYRERFGLKADYPMVSQNYSQVRRDVARKVASSRRSRAGDGAVAHDHDEAVQAEPQPRAKRRSPRKNPAALA